MIYITICVRSVLNCKYCSFNNFEFIAVYDQYDISAYVDFVCYVPNHTIFQTPTITHKSDVVASTVRLPQLA